MFHTSGHFNMHQETLTKQSMPYTWNTTIPATQIQTSKDILRRNLQENIKRKGQEVPVIGNLRVPRRATKQLKDGEVTEEIRKRREKNRTAATKCRLKKRKRTDTLEEKITKYENCNQLLEKEIQEFEDEKRRLLDILDGHKCTKHHKIPNVQQHFEHYYVNVKHLKTIDTSSLQGEVVEQQVDLPQSNTFKESCIVNDESQNVEQFLSEFQDEFWNL